MKSATASVVVAAVSEASDNSDVAIPDNEMLKHFAHLFVGPADPADPSSVDLRAKATAINPMGDVILLDNATLHIDDVMGPYSIHCPVTYKDGCAQASATAIEWPFTFKDKLCNAHKSLHGGIQAFVVDTVTSIHLTLVTGGNRNHVSVELGLQYVRPVPLNEVVVLRTIVQSVGKNLAFMKAEFWTKDTRSKKGESVVGLGKLLSTASHTKMFIADGKNSKQQSGEVEAKRATSKL